MTNPRSEHIVPGKMTRSAKAILANIQKEDPAATTGGQEQPFGVSRKLTLPDRCRYTLELASDGLSQVEIARKMGVSVSTVSTQLIIARKLLGNARTVAQAVAIAVRHGIIL